MQGWSFGIIVGHFFLALELLQSLLYTHYTSFYLLNIIFIIFQVDTWYMNIIHATNSI